MSIPTRRSVVDALAFFESLPRHLTDQQNQIAKAILKELVERLGFLNNVGLDYLNLDRTSGTLSGGESQRIRRSEEHTSELQSLMRISYAVFCLKKKPITHYEHPTTEIYPTWRNTSAN